MSEAKIYSVTQCQKGHYYIYDPDTTNRTDGCVCVCLNEIAGNKYWANDKEAYPDGKFPYIDEVRYWHTGDNCNDCCVLIASSDPDTAAAEFDKHYIETNLNRGYTWADIQLAFDCGYNLAKEQEKGYDMDIDLETTLKLKHTRVNKALVTVRGGRAIIHHLYYK